MAASGFSCNMRTLSCGMWNLVPWPGVKPGPLPWKCVLSCSVGSDSFATPMDYSPPGFSVPWILQARILKWVAISFSRGSAWPRGQTQGHCLEVESLLYPDRGTPPNTTGAADGCKNSEELYYKLGQGLSSHNGEGAPVKAANRFYTV